MRNLLPIFYGTIDKLRSALMKEVNGGEREIDFLQWMERTILEVIGQAGFGYSFDPLTGDAQSEFGAAIKSTFSTLQDVFIFRPLIPYVMAMGPAWFRRLLVELLPFQTVKKLKNNVDIMYHKATKIYQSRKAAILEGVENESSENGERKDILSVLIKENAEAAGDAKLSETEVISQVTTFCVAGTDTSSSTLSRICQLLAQHQDVQDKLREELSEANSRSAGMLSYDDLMKLPLLDSVVRETLRLYAPAVFISREARKDAILPLSKPIRGLDGQMIHSVPIPKDTEIFLGILGSNTNKELWGADALEWKPERWLTPFPSAVADAPIPGVYSKLMSFTGGQKSCIGFKFGELMIKSTLFVLLPTFTFTLTDRPIVWNLATVTYPSMETSGSEPAMLLKMGLASDRAQ